MIWINAKTRLPEDLRDVLVFDGDNVCVGYLLESSDCTFKVMGLECVDGIVTATHWCELPETPGVNEYD